MKTLVEGRRSPICDTVLPAQSFQNEQGLTLFRNCARLKRLPGHHLRGTLFRFYESLPTAVTVITLIIIIPTSNNRGSCCSPIAARSPTSLFSSCFYCVPHISSIGQKHKCRKETQERKIRHQSKMRINRAGRAGHKKRKRSQMWKFGIYFLQTAFSKLAK